MSPSIPTQLVLHAACADSLIRARNNATNFLKHEPTAQIEIVANAGAVAAALDTTHPTDGLLRLCGNTLNNTKKQATTQKVVPAAIVYLIKLLQDGWIYVRA